MTQMVEGVVAVRGLARVFRENVTATTAPGLEPGLKPGNGVRVGTGYLPTAPSRIIQLRFAASPGRTVSYALYGCQKITVPVWALNTPARRVEAGPALGDLLLTGTAQAGEHHCVPVNDDKGDPAVLADASGNALRWCGVYAPPTLAAAGTGLQDGLGVTVAAAGAASNAYGQLLVPEVGLYNRFWLQLWLDGAGEANAYAAAG